MQEKERKDSGMFWYFTFPHGGSILVSKVTWQGLYWTVKQFMLSVYAVHRL
jgi:hypothetical protein